MVNKGSHENFVETIRLGEKIAFFRKQKGISQEALAQKIGKTRSTVAAYENNLADLSIPILRDVAKALGVQLYDFVHELDLDTEGTYSAGNTYVQEMESQIKQLKGEVESLRKELSDKNKIIALYEKRENEIEKREAQIESKLQQMENLYNMLTKKPS